MGLEKIVRKLTPFLLAGSLSVSNCGRGEECANDNQCPGEETCSNGQCLAPAGLCNDDYDCGENQICENYSCVDLTSSLPGVPATTKILDEKAADYLLNVSPDKSIITFSSASGYAKDLKEGDVIVAGIYDSTPAGLLRKVASKTETGSEIAVTTTQARLEDAVEDGTFEGKIAFTPEYAQRATPLVNGVRFGVKEAPLKIDYSNSQILTIDFDETELYDCKKTEKKDPQKKCYCEECKVVLDGSFEVGLKSEIKIDISSFKLKYAKFTLTGTENLDLTLSGEFAASIDSEIPKVTIATFPPVVLPVTIAGFPVIVVPSLNVEFGLEAKGELSLESSVMQSLSATYGVEYKNKNWSDIKDFDYDFDFVPPVLTQSGATARAYIKPTLNFDLYGINGPYTGVEASIHGEVYPLQDPWCSLSAGLWVGVGFEAEVLGYNIVDYKNTLYEYEKELYQCKGTSTCNNECEYLNQIGCSGNDVAVCADYNGDGCLEWVEPYPCGQGYKCLEGECITSGCAPEEWQCADGACISSAWHCDGGADCAGGEDEDGCGCLGENECIYAGVKGCFDEGWKECGDFNGDNCLEWGNYHVCGADEYCSWGKCVESCNEFLCNNGTCIPKSYLCDGKMDCGGWEDENDCPCDDVYETGCYDGDVYEVNKCGEIWKIGSFIKDCSIYGPCVKEEGIQAYCDCTSQHHFECYEGDVYYFDGCYNKEGKAEECGSSLCVDDTCVIDGKCTNDSDCPSGYLCKKSIEECLPEPSPLCTGAGCVQVGIYVYDNGSESDDSFGLEIKDAFYGETPSGGGKEWTVPMVDGQTYEMLLYGIGVPDGIGTYAIELTNAVKVDGPPLEGSDLDDGMSFVWHIKAKK